MNRGTSFVSSRSSFIPLEVSRPRRLPFSKEKNGLLTGFTLIELLVVVAIIAILSVFVILTINPAELLKQGRDSQRVSDIATINSALNLYQVDNVTGSLGTASTTYISIPDNTATSTQGTQCQGLSLPALPTGWTYHCAASSTYRNTDGTGWIPVNFASISYGSPLGSLPADPINSTSTAFYTYTPGGSWQLTAIPESQKIRTTQANQLTGAITQGSNLSLSPLFSSNGLVGYWKFDEGTGTSTADNSGNGNNGIWSGTGSHWSTGRTGYAGQFNGADDYVSVSNSSNATLNIGQPGMTIIAWVYPRQLSAISAIVNKNGPYMFLLDTNKEMYTGLLQGSWFWSYSTANSISLNTWNFIVMSYDGSSRKLYVNGIRSGSDDVQISGNINTILGGLVFGYDNCCNRYYFNGYIDEIRIYNRALSAAEIAALYNATK